MNPVRGLGLVMKVAKPADFCIPYGGRYRDPQEKETMIRHSNDGKYHRRISHCATVEIIGSHGEKERGCMDAHPRVMGEQGIPAGAWPGGFCNQANNKLELNAVLLQHEGKCTAPRYEYLDDRCRYLFIKTTKPVAAGEELLVDYGYSVTRQTLWGFGLKAKQPKIRSEYVFRPRTRTEKYGAAKIES